MVKNPSCYRYGRRTQHHKGMDMAKFMPMLGNIRGSFGGVTFTQCRSTKQVTKRKNPVNPQSRRQAVVRSIMSTVLSRWGSINPRRKKRWEVFAKDRAREDPVGNHYEVSGQQLFVGMNTMLLNVKSNMREDPPKVGTKLPQGPGQSFVAAVVNPNTVWLNGMVGPPAGGRYVVWWSGQVGKTRNPGIGRSRWLWYSGTNPVGIQTAALPYNLPSGAKIKLWVANMDKYGQRSNFEIRFCLWSP